MMPLLIEQWLFQQCVHNDGLDSSLQMLVPWSMVSIQAFQNLTACPDSIRRMHVIWKIVRLIKV